MEDVSIYFNYPHSPTVTAHRHYWFIFYEKLDIWKKFFFKLLAIVNYFCGVCSGTPDVHGSSVLNGHSTVVLLSTCAVSLAVVVLVSATD